jgi:hypothetical protein
MKVVLAEYYLCRSEREWVGVCRVPGICTFFSNISGARRSFRASVKVGCSIWRWVYITVSDSNDFFGIGVSHNLLGFGLLYQSVAASQSSSQYLERAVKNSIYIDGKRNPKVP